jgi:hypothetical protein
MFPPSVNTQIDPSVLRYILSNDYLFFALDPAVHPDGVIYPGEPVSFVWGVYSFFVGTGGEVPQFRDAQATITFDGNIIWPASQVRSGSSTGSERRTYWSCRFRRPVAGSR